MATTTKVQGNDKERYAAYLCSREWNVLKEAVHKRANGLCERCRIFQIDAVHHLTYERKYHEELADLQGICNHCHEFTHSKSDFNPNRHLRALGFIRACKHEGRPPVPWVAIEERAEVIPHLRLSLDAIDHLSRMMESWAEFPDGDGIEVGIIAIDQAMPFRYYSFPVEWYHRNGPVVFEKLCSMLGVEWKDDPTWRVQYQEEED